MTYTDDFAPSDVDFEEGASNDLVLFGIRLTPTLQGVILSLLGLAVAGYGVLNYVIPTLEENSNLRQEVQEKEAQVQDREAIARRIAAAKADLEVSKRQQEEVLSLLANESTLNTLLLDINKQINRRSPAEIERERQRKFAACSPAIRQNSIDNVEKAINGQFVVKPRLEEFVPDPAKSTIINDGSYGQALNNKLKRQVVNITFKGNFEDTRQILQRIEQLQNLLVVRDAKFTVSEATTIYNTNGNVTAPAPICQAETEITSAFQLEALMPLTAEERQKLAPPPNAQQQPPK